MKTWLLAGFAALSPLVAVAEDIDENLQAVSLYAIDEWVCNARFPEAGILDPKIDAVTKKYQISRDEILATVRDIAVKYERKLSMEGEDIEAFCEDRDGARKEEWDDYQARIAASPPVAPAVSVKPPAEDPLAAAVELQLDHIVCRLPVANVMKLGRAMDALAAARGINVNQAFVLSEHEARQNARSMFSTRAELENYCFKRKMDFMGSIPFPPK